METVHADEVVVPDTPEGLTAEKPEWDGPDPRKWLDQIKDLRERIADLDAVQELLVKLSGSGPLASGETYSVGMDFLREAEGHLQGQIAAMILAAYKRDPA